jgi:homocysteine S-methyltransferase
MSHAELDAATELDSGDPTDLAEQYRQPRDRHTHLRVLGGCCGTNHHHIDTIASTCATGVRP